MPMFKSTFNILKTPWEDEVFDPKWMNSNKLILPPGGPDDKHLHWDYTRDMTVEDVDIWEVIYEGWWGTGLYASWCPYAEFYLLTTGLRVNNHSEYNDTIFETFYGPGAEFKVRERMKQIGVPLNLKEHWKNDEDMWLYQPPEKKIIIS